MIIILVDLKSELISADIGSVCVIYSFIHVWIWNLFTLIKLREFKIQKLHLIGKYLLKVLYL